MTLQKIKSINGEDEYVLLPITVYRVLKDQIKHEMTAYETRQNDDQKYEPFVLEDYVDNPVALACIKAGITQEELANRLSVSQAYISQIERRSNVTNKLLKRVRIALKETV